MTEAQKAAEAAANQHATLKTSEGKEYGFDHEAKRNYLAGYERGVADTEARIAEARAQAFAEAARIVYEEAEGDGMYAKFIFEKLAVPSSPESIARLEKIIAKQLERAAKAQGEVKGE